MSPSQQRGAVTAERLVDAALEVFAESGQPGFTVQAVISASGISMGSLYHHFGSFDGLAAALYGRCMAALFDDLIAALDRTRTARTGVRALVLAYLQFTERRPAEAGFIHASAFAGHVAAHAERIAAAKAPQREVIARWLFDRIAAGEVVDAPAPVLEVLLIGPPAEASRRWLAGAPGLDIAASADLIADSVWRSLRA